MNVRDDAELRRQFEVINSFYQNGDFDNAARNANSLLEKHPTLAILHNLLGVIDIRKGHHEHAVDHFKNAIKYDSNFPDAYNNLGCLFRGFKKYDEAVSNFEKAIKVKPDYAEAYYNFATTLANMERRDEAVANYLHALRIVPNHIGAHNNLGILFIRMERFEQAVRHFKQVLKAYPTHFQAYNNLGLALKNLDQRDEALASFDKAIEIKPDYAEAYYNQGNYLFDLGRKEDAAARYAKALDVNPDFAEVYRSMGSIKAYNKTDPEFQHMQEMINREDLTDEERMQLCFSFGKAHEGFGEYDQSFEYYATGNALRKKALGYVPQVERDMFQHIKNTFADAGPHQALKIPESERLAQTPIFIVGMPRSGTSLSEQILASHSEIFGAGELMALGKAANSVWAGPSFDTAQLQKLRGLYLSTLKRFNASEPYITDKMHFNYRLIGFICLAFPEAKIVHIKRRSIASCWSIYKHYFADTGNGYAYDLNDVMEYYKSYMDLMAFWEKRFPGVIHHFSYEDLTENQEIVTRNLLDYLGLEFEQSCIDFHRYERAVATISSMQVRKKLYTGSSDEWRKYEKYLGPLIEEFGVD